MIKKNQGPTEKQNSFNEYVKFASLRTRFPDNDKLICSTLNLTTGDFNLFEQRLSQLYFNVDTAIAGSLGSIDHIKREIAVSEFQVELFRKFEQRSYYGKMYPKEICSILGLSLGDFFLYKELLAIKQSTQKPLNDDNDCSDEGEFDNGDY